MISHPAILESSSITHTQGDIMGNRQFMLTKLAMARVIITALYNMEELAPADHPKVIKRARLPKSTLVNQHKMAMVAIQSR